MNQADGDVSHPSDMIRYMLWSRATATKFYLRIFTFVLRSRSKFRIAAPDEINRARACGCEMALAGCDFANFRYCFSVNRTHVPANFHHKCRAKSPARESLLSAPKYSFLLRRSAISVV